jgi:hypothetical protein
VVQAGGCPGAALDVSRDGCGCRGTSGPGVRGWLGARRGGRRGGRVGQRLSGLSGGSQLLAADGERLRVRSVASRALAVRGAPDARGGRQRRVAPLSRGMPVGGVAASGRRQRVLDPRRAQLEVCACSRPRFRTGEADTASAGRPLPEPDGGCSHEATAVSVSSRIPLAAPPLESPSGGPAARSSCHVVPVSCRMSRGPRRSGARTARRTARGRTVVAGAEAGPRVPHPSDDDRRLPAAGPVTPR